MKHLGARWACACGIAVWGCAPSYQAVYQCDVHFEHCYALDDSDASIESKRQCWRDYLANYTYSQARDRVTHARMRLGELASDSPSTGDTVTTSDRPAAVAASPSPQSAFAPPPIVSEGHPESDSGGGGRSSGIKADRGSGSSAPGADCAETCEKHWSACRSACDAGPCGACDRVYRACMPPCFRDDARSPVR